MTQGAARQDDGYALVAAVAALGAVAVIAWAIAALDLAATRTLIAEQTQARLSAATDAGLALAVRGLSSSDAAQRWSIARVSHRESFDGATLDITVEDERGKVPLLGLDDKRAVRLFKVLGLDDDHARTMADALLDWIDDDDEPRPHGGEATAYAAQGILPRNGIPRSLDEMAAVRGMDQTLLARLKPLVSNHYGATGDYGEPAPFCSSNGRLPTPGPRVWLPVSRCS